MSSDPPLPLQALPAGRGGAAEDEAASGVESISIELCWGDAQSQHRLPLRMPAGSTLGDALFNARLLEFGDPSAQPPTDFVAAGIWGQRCAASTRLRAGDRIELYRALLADPKDARRARVAAQRRV